MSASKRELALAQGISEKEWDDIIEGVGREPSEAEVAVFAAMWNEHVSYKSSRLHLGKFPTEGPGVIVGPGENAGVIDVGNGWAACFKMESHNHPSYIEPFQGAATGVGGILRDIFTMGARPIAGLNSLRFGAPDHPRTKYLVNGVVSGIAYYGNCIGVPTVGGELHYDPTYDGNILVNVFTIGVQKADQIFYGSASVPGSVVIYIGSATGRDGIHGASMASHAFEQDADQKRPTVQVGDSFAEKVLLEACLELMDRGLILGIQDMGAAGLTCSTFEMAARGGTGMKVNLSKVPMRAAGMTAAEVLLSESQERMLLVTSPGSERAVLQLLEHWDLWGAIVGEVTDTGRMQMTFNGEEVVDLDVRFLTDSAPLYDRPSAPPGDLDERRTLPAISGDGKELWEDFLSLLDDPEFRSKRPIFQQYDHMVQVGTVVRPGEADAAVLRIPEDPPRGLAIVSDGNGPMTWLDPRIGGYNIVAESVLNLACVGAKAVGLTDCLNFGNPERPEVMWEFIEAVEGIAEACRAFDTPVTGGNVSFYNETDGASIRPTPVVGVVGVLDDVNRTARTGFVNEDDEVVLLGPTDAWLDGSLYLRCKTGEIRGQPVKAEINLHAALCGLLVKSIAEGLVISAHDVSEGGLLFAIAECIVSSPSLHGARLNLSWAAGDPSRLLFGEAPSRAIVTVNPQGLKRLEGMARALDVPFLRLGSVGGTDLRADPFLTVPVESLVARHNTPPPGM
ncbi:MAG: phosphoribosylformylglycinamidine synthase subunit PurL [Deltaproteobacteria bacterium]|nr:phosphoribosylformylglycinamidine synthase subunit PurL [Deltaproteobacteria bacterium]